MSDGGLRGRTTCGGAGVGGRGADGRCWGWSRIGSGNFLGTTEREMGEPETNPERPRGTERGSERGTEGQEIETRRVETVRDARAETDTQEKLRAGWGLDWMGALGRG